MAYRLTPDTCDGPHVIRAIRGRLSRAVEALAESDTEAVHTARTCLKQARSALRLIRRACPDVYDQEDAVLREAGRRLSPLRDRQVMMQTIDARYADDAGYPVARETVIRAGPGPTEAVPWEQAADETATLIDAVRERLADADVPGGSGVIDRGWQRTLKRARKAYRSARRSANPDNLHRLRKRIKDVMYQARLLRDVRPKRMNAARKQAGRIADLLGDHHDLTILDNTLRSTGAATPAHLLDRIDSDRAALADKALRKTRRLLKRSLAL